VAWEQLGVPRAQAAAWAQVRVQAQAQAQAQAVARKWVASRREARRAGGAAAALLQPLPSPTSLEAVQGLARPLQRQLPSARLHEDVMHRQRHARARPQEHAVCAGAR